MLPRQTKRIDNGGVVVVSFEVSLTAVGTADPKELCPALLRVRAMRAVGCSTLGLFFGRSHR